jgi:SpoIID/LytB domain protein
MRTFLCLFLLLFVCSQTQISAQITDKSEQDTSIEDQFIRLKTEQGLSHASGNRPELGQVILGNPSESVITVRVGLYANTFNGTGGIATEFSTLHHQTVQISNTLGSVNITDRATGSVIAAMQSGEIFSVTFDGTNYIITGPDSVPHPAAGPIHFSPSNPDNFFRINSILRTNVVGGGTIQPTYRGTIEISRGSSTTAGRVNLINIVEIEKYVRGVVANESIASFHAEALKSQATAARGYAVANIGRYFGLGYPFDIVDSSTSQVYRGVTSEHANAIAATDNTTGLVASYNGQIISALYSSSFGGYSDGGHWIFNSPSTQWPGTNVTPYLTGIHDGEGTAPDLDDPTIRQTYWSAVQPTGYDMCGRVNNRFSRWRMTIPAASIKTRLVAPRFVLISGDITGDVTAVEPILRMTGSNRIAIARITLTTGVVEIRGWDNMRNVLGRTVTSEPAVCTGLTAIAANFTLTNPSLLESYNNPDSSFGGVVASGGGWGHNTGMSQYGAHGRGLAGQTFFQILKSYYQGVDIGTYPINIGRALASGPTTPRQQFIAPNAIATLVVRSGRPQKLSVQINGTHDIMVVANGITTIDLSPYVVQGLNTIQYNPMARGGNMTVNVNVE